MKTFLDIPFTNQNFASMMRTFLRTTALETLAVEGYSGGSPPCRPQKITQPECEILICEGYSRDLAKEQVIDAA